jgi:hypothetical protein
VGAAGDLAEPELPVVAGADRRFADAVDPGVGDFQPCGLGLKSRDESLFLIPEEYNPPQRCWPPTSTPTKTAGTR